MNKIFYLVMALLMISSLSAQNKTLTVYYGIDSTKVVNIANSDSIVIFICGVSKVSYGGKDYNTVLIGTQCWLKENLNIGTMILGANDQTNNSILEKYCYNNDTANCTIYGGLYQWNEAMQYLTTAGTKGICPEGWHLPTDVEFQTLSTSVSGDGNALKREDQGSGGGQGTNTSGFSALLAGGRYGGGFVNLGLDAIFWSSTEYNVNNAIVLDLYFNVSDIYQFSYNKVTGFSVRCIKKQ